MCAPNHFPGLTSFSVATIVSRYVERNSRLEPPSYSADIACDAAQSAGVRPLISAIFIVTIGV